MQRIPVKFAAAGMKLEKEAVTPEGQILCGTGTELTAELISRLSSQGVATLVVQGHPVTLPGEKTLTERLRDLEYRFSRVNRDPVLKALKKLVAELWIVQERGPDALETILKAGEKGQKDD